MAVSEVGVKGVLNVIGRSFYVVVSRYNTFIFVDVSISAVTNTKIVHGCTIKFQDIILREKQISKLLRSQN